MIAPFEPVQPPAALDLSHALELRTKYEPAARAKLAAHWKHVWLQGQLDLMLDSLLEALPLSAEQVLASDGL